MTTIRNWHPFAGAQGMAPSNTPNAAVPRPDAPSPWIERFAAKIPTGGVVLDLAAGGGRHSRFLLARGHPVVAIDRDVEVLVGLGHPGLTVIQADLECGRWPLG